MRRSQTLLFLASVWCLIPLAQAHSQEIPLVQAHSQDVSFEHVPLQGGYVSNFVNRVVQDPQGFLWLATRAWLIKYDGYGTTTYRHNPQDSTSLASSKWVETVYVDKAGTLWLGTYGGGLDRFNPGTESFTHFAHDPLDPTSLSGDTVTVMLEDRDGTFWVGTHQGLNRMDREAGTFTPLRHDPNDPTSLSNDQVRALFEDRQGTLWVGTGSPWGSESPPRAGGLNRFDPKTETFTRYLHDPSDPTSLIDNHVTALFEDSRDTFWVGTAEDGLHTMDRQQGTFTRHTYDPTDPTRLSKPHLDEITGASYVSVVHEDRSGALWIGAMNGGLNRYDPATGQLVSYNDTPRAPGSLGSTAVIGMFESREGILWVVTWDGLFRVVQRQTSIGHYMLDAFEARGANSVRTFLEDEDGTFWIGTESGGLSHFDWREGEPLTKGLLEPTRRYLHDPDDPHSLSDNTVVSLYQDQDGVLWVGTASGLDRMDRNSGRFTRYQHDPADPRSLGAGEVFSICEDQRGVLWVGLFGGGLSRFDRETGRFKRYVHDAAIPNSLSDDDVVAVHPDRDGFLWIGTMRGGLNGFDPREESFRRYPYPVADSSGLSDGFISSIYEDEGGMLWIGTMLGGLNQFDRSTGRFTHFTTANSALPDNRIQRILEDEEGDLWVSTGNGTGSGLARYDRDEDRFFTYDPDLVFPTGNALPGSYKRRSGELFFGGDNGFVVFSPREVVRNTIQNSHPPQVVLTGLRVFNTPVRPGKDTRLTDLHLDSRAVTLPHDENTFSFNFVGLHFENPAENRYSYMLEGYDETWREAGMERRAGYYKVAPGDYVFRVKAANSDGIWNEEGTSIRVSVLPPWWSTKWAYMFYGVFLLGSIVGADRVLRRRVVRREREATRERELEQKREIEGAYNRLRVHEQQLAQQNVQLEDQARRLEQTDELKNRFFANVSHEFRTPLTLLLGPIRDHLEGRIDAKRLAGHAALMHRSARRLLGLINQLLDLSRLEAGGMQLNARRRDLVAFLRRHVLTFTSHAEREGVALVFTSVPEQIEMTFDADMLEKIVSNLLSNAFKFTPSGGRVRVTARLIDDVVEIAVRDTGEGLAAEDLPLVFDRFYQVDSSSTRRHEGSGIGLSLAAELVELHGGTIDVESERGFGSTFTIRLPVDVEQDVASERIGASDQPRKIPGTKHDAEHDVEYDAGHDIEHDNRHNGEHDVPAPRTEQPHEVDDRTQAGVSPDAKAPGNAPRILIVEDNADMRGYMTSYLAGAYRLLEAKDGADGLRQAREHRPDLVISDVMMPEMDGFALCDAIKSDKSIGHIPVVLLTARVDEASRMEGFRSGADDYLPKPFSLDELATRVENLVEIRRRLLERFSGTVRLGPAEILVTSEDASFIEGVRDVIEAEMGDSQFGVNRLAEEMGVSERQLHRRVKETAGLTPAAYIRMMRLERAFQLLEQQSGRVSDVAYAVGFKSPKHFSRLYRQTFGHSPSDGGSTDLPH